ncbi:Hexokinase [Geosmithia morbida]|uniref:Phosphotransferase n=1 Tax=Geosmithia morbida TaxID=1094350 RepID=A0A9P5D9R4_9HYPO|nr:Hexokinase [Geosmithia morbida]KAF4126799.1 Hexokinase [Geosmithia morbida]
MSLVDMIHDLSSRFLTTFAHLSAESTNQFLPTPISDAILRPVGRRGSGCYLSMDIGGSNLRVGFVEVVGRHETGDGTAADRIKRHLEESWSIDDRLKNDNADSLFEWIGSCVARVVDRGCSVLDLARDRPLPLGVTFSFPMEQTSLAEARLMSMGKGFAVSANLDLGSRLLAGYDVARRARQSSTPTATAAARPLPPLRVAAIANDSVSTLVSFIVRYDDESGCESETAVSAAADVEEEEKKYHGRRGRLSRRRRRRACMGLILGTGCNATIPLPMSRLHPSKRPPSVSVLPGSAVSSDVRVTVNTEWSINGTAPPLRAMGLVSRWDRELDSANEAPGFQPLEYMTAGRYLGELGRIMLVDYLTSVMGVDPAALPPGLLRRHSMTTTFLSHFRPLRRPAAHLLASLEAEFPAATAAAAAAVGPGLFAFAWTEDMAVALYHIAKAIEVRAAGIVAAATVALLILGGELSPDASDAPDVFDDLGVGYTGGCIVHFQDYLVDCQAFIDGLVARRLGPDPAQRVVLSPCHDGGITGAGILVAAASESEDAHV